MRAFLTGIGIVSPAGNNVPEALDTLKRPERCISPLSLFPVPEGTVLPVGEIPTFHAQGDPPRTHALAVCAARQAMEGRSRPPDAVVVGTTTGGILTTEPLLKKKVDTPDPYRNHTPGTVAEWVARSVGCRGQVLTASTACASGTTILVLALELVRTQSAERVLAVGVDSLCRLTYFGFSMLKLVDPVGARPFDRDRAGLSVGEAAAAMLIEAGTEPPEEALCEIRGGGLSCDAHHVTAPDPEGRGAALAIRNALRDAGLEARRVDYVNLHGTGTPDNDAAEAGAVRAVFGDALPAVSSTKGIYGHPLAAAGTVEAVFGALCIRHGILPANTGCAGPDPALGLVPMAETKRHPVGVILSNSFGFGGNDACVVLSSPGTESPLRREETPRMGFQVLGSSCITGAGYREESLAALETEGGTCLGQSPEEALARHLESAPTRRMKRLPRLTLSLAISARRDSGRTAPPRSVYFGTGLGALSETHDFLFRLFKSGEKFSSPTDFVGSLHNSPAGQVALHFGSRGANVTVTGTDDSFEEALYCASVLAREEDAPILCLAADEAHEVMTPLIDRSAGAETKLSDGGGALLLKPAPLSGRADILPLFLGFPGDAAGGVGALARALQEMGRLDERFGAVFVGIPGAVRETAETQLAEFLSATDFSGPVVDYRRTLGQYATVSAAACVLAREYVRAGHIAPALGGDGGVSLEGRGILLLGLGPKVSAIAIQG
jgi:3-oxoacyl-[acyl-carrier-protein] synthase-1/3-oxoacyl-[acyl-carrier-protein] synthase II